jgi:integrase
MQQVLTDALLKAAATIPGKRLEVTDLRCSGLTFRVTERGVKSWSFRFRDRRTGRLQRATLGRYPDVTLARARARADELRGRVAADLNPLEERRREREEAASRTFGAVAERYLNEHARRRKRSAESDARILRLHVLPQWNGRRFDQITRADVIALVERLIGVGKHALANRTQALVSTIFTFGIDAGLAPANPCARLKRRGVERARDRVLTDDEIKLLWEGDFGTSVGARRIHLGLRLALLTAARIGEVAGARMSELGALDDSNRAAWLIPATRSKNKRPRLVPLSDTARSIFLELTAAASGDILFPSPQRLSMSLTGQAFASALGRFAQRLSGPGEGVQSWKAAPPRSHDARRTVATRLSAMGFAREDRKAVLGHIETDVHAAHYDLYDRAREKRRALNAWADALSAIISGGEASNILPLAGMRRPQMLERP